MFFAAVSLLARADDSYRIVHTYPHDPRAYTQGLVYIDGRLYESTGLNGQSSLRMDDLATGRVLQKSPLAERYFGEGLAAWGSTLVQLTWQAHIAFVHDRFSFRLLRTFLNRAGTATEHPCHPCTPWCTPRRTPDFHSCSMLALK
ncbi:MAG: glutaminyl-peptide cyclotransferase [Terracidiphilus sp.]